MIPEPKHLSQQQSTETKLHREELQGGSGQQERMRGQSVYEIKALLRTQKCGTNWKMGRERCVGGSRALNRTAYGVNLSFVAMPLS